MNIELSTGNAVNMLVEDEYAGWTYSEAEALVEYYEDLGEDIGTTFDFDVVAIRCEWTCFDNIAEVREHYNDCAGLDTDEEVLDWLRNNTQVIVVSNGSTLVSEF